MGIWPFGHLGIWACGYLGIFVFGHSLGHLGMWVFGHVGIWEFGHWFFGNFSICPFGPLGICVCGHLDIWEFGHLRIWVFVIWPSGQFPKYPPKNRAQMPICPNEYRNAQITTSPNAKIIKCPKAFGHLSNHLDICSFVHLAFWAFGHSLGHLTIWAFVHLGMCFLGMLAKRPNGSMLKYPNLQISK
jgi:hypothetical protein